MCPRYILKRRIEVVDFRVKFVPAEYFACGITSKEK